MLTAMEISLAFAWRNHKKSVRKGLSLGLRGFKPARTRSLEGEVTKSVSVGLSLIPGLPEYKGVLPTVP